MPQGLLWTLSYPSTISSPYLMGSLSSGQRASWDWDPDPRGGDGWFLLHDGRSSRDGGGQRASELPSKTISTRTTRSYERQRREECEIIVHICLFSHSEMTILSNKRNRERKWKKRHDYYLLPNPSPTPVTSPVTNNNRRIMDQLLCIYVTADPVRTAWDSVAVSAVFWSQQAANHQLTTCREQEI